jgi:hypothetical protein
MPAPRPGPRRHVDVFSPKLRFVRSSQPLAPIEAAARTFGFGNVGLALNGPTVHGFPVSGLTKRLELLL